MYGEGVGECVRTFYQHTKLSIQDMYIQYWQNTFIASLQRTDMKRIALLSCITNKKTKRVLISI